VIFEAGYRNQVTAGPQTQTLSVYPVPIVRIGLRGRNEIVISPGFIYSERVGQNSASGLAPASGMQDIGFGFKHLLHDRVWMQDAVNVFVTLPTGYPAGTSGFTAGLSTYALGYSAVFALSSRAGLSTTQNIIANAAPNSAGGSQRFLTYQPSFAASYALSSNLTLLIEDQISLSTAPASSTGNRSLAGIQCTISPNAVLDAEFEANLLPIPGTTQHALGAGLTFQF
jgi:hypothetical protein